MSKDEIRMKELIQLQQQIVPELLDIMEQRYIILEQVQTLQPIGRRTLAENANLTERQVRGEIHFLQQQGLIEVTKRGMFVTKKGTLLLEKLSKLMKVIKGLSVLEKKVGETLNINEVIVVSGNSDEDPEIKQEMGKACVDILKQMVKKNSTIAVTGGTTMAALADVMTPFNQEKNVLFVPARGGSGEKMENQAGRIVAEMARKTGGKYRLFHAPELLSDSAYESLSKEPSIKEVLNFIKNADIVIHGIGDALTMAERRKTPSDIIEILKEEQAVGEAFGYYFNGDGEIVYKLKTLGIHLEDLDRADYVIAVAGGKSKAKAIQAYAKQGKSDLLITDSAAAEEIVRGNPL